MKRRLALSAVAAALLLGAAPADKAPTVKEIMEQANKPNGLFFDLKRDLRDDDPMWEDMKGRARELLRLAEALPKAKPPQGAQASWDRLTRDNLARVKALAQAVENQDKKAARTAHDRLGAGCKGCHDVHRPK